MSRNDILPEGMYWFYNYVSKKFYLIVEKDCKYQDIEIDKKAGVER